MTVLQLVGSGSVPDQCAAAMRGVETWALAAGHDYLAEPFEVPEGWCPYARSNYLRAAAVSVKAPMLYVDWDVIVEPWFEISDPSKPWCDKDDPDAVFYSPNVSVWKDAFEEMKAYYSQVPTAILEISRLWKILNRRIAEGQYCPSYFFGGYTHFHQRSSHG